MDEFTRQTLSVYWRSLRVKFSHEDEAHHVVHLKQNLVDVSPSDQHQASPTCLKPSCYAPPTRACGAGSPPAGTSGRLVGSWLAASPPGWPCPCETPRETRLDWAPTPRSPARLLQHYPETEERRVRGRLRSDDDDDDDDDHTKSFLKISLRQKL